MAEPITRLRLRVSPGATGTKLVGRHADGWKVRVSAAPERGRANDAVVGLLSRQLGVPRASVSIVSGHASRDKVVELRGLARGEAERRLGQPAPAPPGLARGAKSRTSSNHLRPKRTETA